MLDLPPGDESEGGNVPGGIPVSDLAAGSTPRARMSVVETSGRAIQMHVMGAFIFPFWY
jgi:hypothetical protein